MNDFEKCVLERVSLPANRDQAGAKEWRAALYGGPPVVLDQLSDALQAFALGIIRADREPPGVSLTHRWIARTPRGGSITWSTAGYQRSKVLVATGYVSDFDAGFALGSAVTQAWSKAMVAELLVPEAPTAKPIVRAAPQIPPV